MNLIFRSRSHPCLPLFNLPTLKFFRLIKFGAPAESDPTALIARPASSPENETKRALRLMPLWSGGWEGRRPWRRPCSQSCVSLGLQQQDWAVTNRAQIQIKCRCNVRRRSRWSCEIKSPPMKHELHVEMGRGSPCETWDCSWRFYSVRFALSISPPTTLPRQYFKTNWSRMRMEFCLSWCTGGKPRKRDGNARLADYVTRKDRFK
jgi:hypothetical protein